MLKEVDHAKYLGALIDNKLNWSYQINAVNLKLSKGIGLLAKIRHYVPISILRSLRSLVHICFPPFCFHALACASQSPYALLH